MARNRRSGPRRRRTRTWRIVLVALIAAGAGAYPLYRWQANRNTLRLLADAEAARRSGSADDAIRAYRAYLSRAGNYADALHDFSDLLWTRLETAPESIGETIRVFRRLNRLRPDDLQTLRRLTQLHLAVRDYVSAEELASQWSKLAPDDIDSVLLRAQALHGLGKDAETVQLLADAAAARPNQPRLYPPLIELLTVRLLRPDDARPWVDRALQTNPDAYEVQLAASAYFDRQHDRANADTHLEQAIRLAPDAPRVLIAAAAYYTRNDRLDLGGTYLARARKTAPLDRSLLSAWAEFALKSGVESELRDAADALSAQATEHEPELLVQAAAMQIRARRFDKGDELLAKLTTLNVESVTSAIPLLRGARALFADEPYAALPHLERAVALRPQDAWAAEMLALALARVGAVEESDAAYRHVLSLSPDARSAQVALARNAWRRGEPEQARARLEGLLSGSATDSNRPGVAYAKLLQQACTLELSNNGRPLPAQAMDPAFWTQLAPAIEHARSDPASAEVIVRIAKLLSSPSRIVELAASRLQSDPPDTEAALALARAARNDDVPEAADRIATLLMQEFPHQADGYIVRAASLASDGSPADSFQFVQQCPLRGAPLGRVWEAVAESLFETQHTEQALQAARNAVVILPNDSSALRMIARHTPDLSEGEAATAALRASEGDAGLHWRYERAALLLRLKPNKASAEEAAPLLRACLDRRPSWVAARLLLGLAEEMSGNDEAAADAYLKAVAEQPSTAINQTALRLIEVLKRLGRFEEADATLDKLAGNAKAAPDVLRLQTQRYLRNRNLHSAVDAAEQLLALRSDDPAWANLTADLQIRAGNATRAEQIAREQLERNPASTPALWTLARALIAQSRPDEAERVARTQAESQNNAQQFVLLAQLLTHLNKPDDAAAAIDRALAIAPDDATIHGAASDHWAARGDREKQLTAARQAVSLRHEDPAESLVLARILAETGTREQRAEAVAIVSRRLNKQPNDVPTLMLEAKLARAADPPDLDRAETSLNRVLAIEPKSATAHRLLAGLQLETGRPTRAFDTVTAGLNANPNDPDLLIAAAEVHAFRGEHRAAVPLLRRALSQNPSSVTAKRLLVTAYQHTDQLDLAEQLLTPPRGASKVAPVETVLLARVKELRGDTAGAESLFRRAAETDGDDSGESFREYLYFLARKRDFEQIYALAGDHHAKRPGDVATYLSAGEILAAHASDDALVTTGFEWLQDVAEHRPAWSDDARFRIALAHYQRGNIQKAESAFEDAVQRNPRAAGAVNALAWLYTEDAGKPEAAFKLLESFVRDGGRETAEMLDTFAATLHRLGRLDDARAKLTRCMAIAGQTPTLTTATFRMGRILDDAGSKSEARTYLRDALELNKRLGGLSDAEIETAKSRLGG